MAQQPLIVQRPTVSLIGGQELQKASGAGVPVPDLSNAFSTLSARLEQKAKENNRMVDQIAGRREAEAGWTGKDGNAFRRFTLPDGSVDKQAAYTDTMENNAISYMAADADKQLTDIGARTDIGTAEKVALWNGVADGYMTNLDPIYKAAARKYFTTEINQRRNYLVAEDLRKNQAIALEGVKNRIDTNTDLAISAGTAGADATQYLDQVTKATDELVELRIVDQATADDLKVQRLRLIRAAQVQGRVATEALHGNVDIDELENFAMALKAGGSEKLHMDEFYEPSNFNLERGREGNYKRHELLDSDEIRQQLGKDETTDAVATELLQVANLLQQKRAGYLEDKKLFEAINKIGENDRLPRQFDTAYNKMADRMVQDLKIMDSPEGVKTIVNMVWHTKVLPQPILDAISLRVFSNDVDTAKSALSLWNTLVNAESGNKLVGDMIRQSISPTKAAELDAATQAMTEILSKGDPKATGDQWQRFIKRSSDPAFSIEGSKEAYRAATASGAMPGTSLDSAMRDAFIDEYGMNSLDPEWAKEFTEAYHISMVLTENPDAIKIFGETMERLKNRWSAGEIYEGGIEKAGPLDNPEFYGKKFSATDPSTWSATDKYQWINDYVHFEINKLMDQGVLDLDPEEKQYLEDVFGAGNPTFLGEHMTLQATGANHDQPQFNIILNMPGGRTTLHVKDEKGRSIPLLLDPSAVRAHLNSKAQVAKEIEKKQQGAENLRIDMIRQKWTADRNAAELAGRTLLPSEQLEPLNDDEFTQWFMAQPEDWQTKFTKTMKESREGLEKQIQRLNDGVVKLPKDVDIGPTELIQSRAAGEDIVVAAASRINSILPDPTNGQFLVNIAAVESNYGRAPGTFRLSGDRGICQINDGDTGAFREIVRQANIPGTKVAVAAAKLRTIGIDVATMTSQDLEKPLYSFAVARLYMMLNPGKEPVTVEEQAQAWKDHYNTALGAGTVDGFIAAADKVLMPTPAFAAADLEANGPGMVTDVGGNAYPENFTETRSSTQTAALRLSAAFGKPLRVTPHGGRSARASASSQHPQGTALDIYVADYTDAEKTRLIATAVAMGYRGIGGYAAGAGVGTIHLDLRSREGNGPGGLAVWWRKQPGVDGAWNEGQQWFVDGINQGLQIRSTRGARSV